MEATDKVQLYRLKVNTQIKIFHVNNKKEGWSGSVSIQAETSLGGKMYYKRQRGKFHNDKGQIHQEDITIKNVYVLNKIHDAKSDRIKDRSEQFQNHCWRF